MYRPNSFYHVNNGISPSDGLYEEPGRAILAIWETCMNAAFQVKGINLKWEHYQWNIEYDYQSMKWSVDLQTHGGFFLESQFSCTPEGIEVDTWVCDENGWAGRGKKFGNWSMSKLRRLCRKNGSGDPLQIKGYYDAIYQDLYPKALESLEACIRTVSRLQSKRG